MSLKMANKLFKIADSHYCDAWSIHYHISLYTRIYNMHTFCSKQSFNKDRNKRSCSHPTRLILSNGKSKSHIQLIIWMLRTDCFTINTVSHSSTVTQSLGLCVCFVDRCLSCCPFSFGHCVFCSSSIYGFWLPLWYLQTFLL